MNENENPESAPLEVVGTEALAAIERAQIDTQIATARRYPRNIAAVKKSMMDVATLDEETASACFYTLPRGGKTIQGPSVRLAEIALSAYGNVKAATRILTVHTGDNPHAVVQAVVHDLEKNVAYSVEKRRRITTKKNRDGTRKPVDDDDIQLAVNSGSAIAFRDSVFKVVPGALIKPVYDQAKRVAVGDVKSLAVQRGKIVDRLKQMGITEDRIFAVIGVKRLDEVVSEHLEILIGLGTALRDGATTIEEAFPPIATEPTRPVFNRSAEAPAPTGSQSPAATPSASAPTASAPTPEPKAAAPASPAPQSDQAPAPKSPQEQLADIVNGAGFTFDDFASYCAAAGFGINDAPGFEEVPLVRAKQMVKAAGSLIVALKERKEGAQ